MRRSEEDGGSPVEEEEDEGLRWSSRHRGGRGGEGGSAATTQLRSDEAEKEVEELEMSLKTYL